MRVPASGYLQIQDTVKGCFSSCVTRVEVALDSSRANCYRCLTTGNNRAIAVRSPAAGCQYPPSGLSAKLSDRLSTATQTSTAYNGFAKGEQACCTAGKIMRAYLGGSTADYRICLLSDFNTILFCVAGLKTQCQHSNPDHLGGPNRKLPVPFALAFSTCKNKYQGSSHLVCYVRKTAVLFVHSSNHHEGTLPRGFTKVETYQLLTEIWNEEDKVDPCTPCDQTWHADGGHNHLEAKAQLLQHMRALKYIMTHLGPLTENIVKETHAILMNGAIQDSGEKLTVGYGKAEAYATTGHVYMDADSVKEYVQDYIHTYNSAASKGTDPYQLAAKLFYGLIHLVHPFENGNGCLGRLLVSFVLMSLGTPFPLPFMNGHHKPAKLYRQMVSHYAKHDHYQCLEGYILECYHYRWTDFADLHEEMHRLGH